MNVKYAIRFLSTEFKLKERLFFPLWNLLNFSSVGFGQIEDFAFGNRFTQFSNKSTRLAFFSEAAKFMGIREARGRHGLSLVA